jgi:hypothetical protein
MLPSPTLCLQWVELGRGKFGWKADIARLNAVGSIRKQLWTKWSGVMRLGGELGSLPQWQWCLLCSPSSHGRELSWIVETRLNWF